MAAYIVRVGGLQLSSSVEEILQKWEDTVPVQTGLDAGKELEVAFDVAPVPRSNLFLHPERNKAKNVLKNLGLHAVDHQKNRS